MKKLSKHISKKTFCKLTNKAAFSQHIETLCENNAETNCWQCCSKYFHCTKDIHKHVSLHHMDDVQHKAAAIRDLYVSETKKSSDVVHPLSKLQSQSNVDFQCSCKRKQFVVLLFYHYVFIEHFDQVCSWQRELGNALNLTGKIRVASEGINGTVEGCTCATTFYRSSLLKHPLFAGMVVDDFKSSEGSGQSFDDLRVSICSELCTMGIQSHLCVPTNGGKYLSPEELHHHLENVEQTFPNNKKSPLILDCRNFYESKIGHFAGALKPDLRKFSYFPEYVNSNRDLFDDKEVIMYCTGGIRCERASAYLKQATNCSEVFQLKGGIHRYIEKYPDGHFKGKLFVFDNRYSIGGDDSLPVSCCQYCNKPYDSYHLCSTDNCRQLVLICEACRSAGHTTCCLDCKENADLVSETKQCECTDNRSRVKVEAVS